MKLATMSRDIKNMIIKGLTGVSPFSSSKGKLYANYDKIVITDRLVEFHFGSTPVVYIEHNARFAQGETLVLGHLEGRTELDLL